MNDGRDDIVDTCSSCIRDIGRRRRAAASHYARQPTEEHSGVSCAYRALK